MNSIKNWGAALVVLVAVIASCTKATYRKTPGGMPYQVYKGGDTQRIRSGNWIKVHLVQKIKDSVYFSTEGKLPLYMQVNPAPQRYDISEVWTQIKRGDSIVSTQMMDTFINRAPENIPPQFSKGDRIITYAKVIDVFTSDSAAGADEEKGKKEWLAGEIKTVEKYLADKNIKAEKTPSGAFVEVITPGTGSLVTTGNYVSVNYTGTSWSGKKFDSNTDTAFHHVEPYSFAAGTGRMIKGFDEAMMFLRKGGKARVYIPSLLAYGANSGSPNIKPYEHLIFDIELLNIQDKEPQPQQPPVPPQPQQK